MDRLRQRLAVARKAVASLREILEKPVATRIERDAAIQRFEYSVEAVWRLAQRYLSEIEGLDVASPKGAIRLCREEALLTDQQASAALDMIDDRNLTVHTYNEQLAQRIYRHLPRHMKLLETWLERMGSRIPPSQRQRRNDRSRA